MHAIKGFCACVKECCANKALSDFIAHGAMVGALKRFVFLHGGRADRQRAVPGQGRLPRRPSVRSLLQT